MVKSKTCTVCQQTKPTGEFDRRKQARDGLSSLCKECRREAVRRSRAKDPEAQRAKRRAELERNRERSRQQHAEWHKANRDRVLATVKAWRHANPEKATAIYRRRRERAREAFVEHVDRDLVYERAQGVCGICGQPTDPARWTIDHIIPLSRGGTHEYANVQIAHLECNSRKGTSLPAA